MQVLVIGSGGREHALVWKLAQSPRVKKIWCAPGNGGIARHAELVPIKAEDIEGLLKFSKDNKIDLVVVGPERPLALGIVDRFQAEGIKTFGPTRELARMESSKAFSKELMKKFKVPTAEFKIFKDSQQAKDYIRTKGTPIVIKADGLAFGKGVIVAKEKEEALGAVSNIMDFKLFGNSGDSLIIEECLEGEEASILVVSDGRDYVCLAPSQDHKRIYDDDKGPNTGGMGAYSPAPIVTDELFSRINEEIISPIIKGLADEGQFYRGVLYAGLMLTKEGPKVLEFNVRFGDPEAQAILPRLKTDLVDVIEASIDGNLGSFGALEWRQESCVCVVAASGGYPGDYKKGLEIRGLEEVDALRDVIVFHAGTRLEDGKIVTDGGRVLGITGLGEGIENAINKAYNAVSKVSFEGMYYRKDIGAKALALEHARIKV
ncbi:MAG: phosphoribosylamine--glycine ligase [Candidatus Omnitrophica bacterium]|nr:phosphoribosylamine--glycine ligase [Candidatus Omnitrophota bacterium]